MYYLVTFSFDLDASFALIMLTTATSNLIGAIPNTSGGIGTFEWATKITLVSFGIQTEPAVAYAAALHVVSLAAGCPGWVNLPLDPSQLSWRAAQRETSSRAG